MKIALRKLFNYWLPPRSTSDNCRECGGANWLPWWPPERSPHEFGCSVRQQELIEELARSLHETGSILVTLEAVKELYDHGLFINGEPTAETTQRLRKLTNDCAWAEAAVAGMRWMSRLVDGKELGPLPLYSTHPLPASPICEHGNEQRWCNESRRDGRICADVQMAIDLRRRP